MAKPKISLCMIVRNEEQMIPRFLQKAAGVWDELCVVDTGSEDRTIELFTAVGAKVKEIIWQNDFAAARNESLAMATGEWILYLDPDELMSLELIGQIRAVCKREDVGAATVIMRNPVAHGHYHEAPLLRLFRRDRSVRFQFPIHETVVPTVEAYLKRTGRKLLALSGALDHLGYQRDIAAGKNKKERDRAILASCLAQDPADFYSHFKLLELARFWKDHELLKAAAVAAIEELEHAGATSLEGFRYAGELIVLLAEGSADGDIGREMEVLRRWPVESSAAFLLKRGEVLERLGMADEAQADFLQCLAIGEDRLMQRVTVRPWLGLARLSIAAGDFSTAIRQVDHALETGPRDPEALFAAIALRRISKNDSVEAFIAHHQELYGDSTELGLATADDAFERSDFGVAAERLSHLVGSGYPDSRVQLRLAQALLGAGRVEDSLVAAQQLLPERPEAIAGVLICNLLKGVDTQIEVELSLAELDAAMRQWIAILQKSSQQELLERFKKMSPAIENLFPWLSSL